MPSMTASETPVGVAPFEALVVLGAHPGEQGDFFAAQTRDAAAAAEVGQSGLLRREFRAPRGEELADVVAVVHGSNLRRHRRSRGCLSLTL